MTVPCLHSPGPTDPFARLQQDGVFLSHHWSRQQSMSGSQQSEGTLRQSGSLSGSLVLPEAAIAEERNGNEAGQGARRSFGNANLGMTSNIDLLEERSERDLVTGQLKANGIDEPFGVDAVEKELASGLSKASISGSASRPRSGTGDARVQEAQQKAAGEFEVDR